MKHLVQQENYSVSIKVWEEGKQWQKMKENGMCRKHSLPALGWAKIHEERDISIGILEKYPLESTLAAVCCQDWSELQEVPPVHASMPHEPHDWLWGYVWG